jgi:iron uptake system component EfeO
MRRRTLGLLVAVPLLLAACGGDDSDGADTDGDTGAGVSTGATGDGATFAVTISDAGCSPDPIEVMAGTVTVDVTNDGSASVTEFEVLDADDHVVGEIENVVPGTEKSFSVMLEPGTYVSYCPNGTDVERGTIDVTAG